MPTFGNNANFQGNQAVNMAAEVLAAAPGSAVLGRVYYDSALGALRVCTNTTGPVFATLATSTVSFAAPAFTLGTTNAAGNSGSAVASNSTIAAFDTTNPTTSAVGDAPTPGAAGVAARRDHTHGREAFGAITAATTYGQASSNGAATTLARADHNHGTPTHGHTDHNAIVLNDLAQATGGYNMGGFVITNAGTPAGSTDLATKGYVDSTAQGLSPKPSAFVATTAALPAYTVAGNVLTASANGALSIDGQSPTAGEVVLVKNEANAQYNGLYTVTNAGSGAAAWVLTRHSSMSTAAEIPGAYVFVEAGTANATTGWVVSSPTAATAFTLNTTAITWTQFSGAGTYTAGTGLTLSANQFSISASYAGQASITTLGTIGTGTWQGTAVGVAFGGTGQGTAGAARGTGGIGAATTAPTGAGTSGVQTISAQGVPTKVIATIGDGTTTSIPVNHNLGTTDVNVSVYAAASPYSEVVPDIQHTSVNTVTLVFSTAPSASQYKVVVIG